MPQCRPIEDYFGWVTKIFGKNGCSAAKTDKLCIRKKYMQFVQRKFRDIRKNPACGLKINAFLVYTNVYCYKCLILVVTFDVNHKCLVLK